uniref:lymphotoxin-beta isoform X1 n=1 Tax=Callithrix jacchus TaxID=9483 RepID=UPI0023DD4346|nr:lymphotoxin-beta isoform X1 [Callithrix jacchus]
MEEKSPLERRTFGRGPPQGGSGRGGPQMGVRSQERSRRVSEAAGGGARNRSRPRAPSCPPHRRSAEGAGASLGGDEGTGVSEQRDAVLGRRGAGSPSGRPLLPLLFRRLPGPGAPWRRGSPGPLGHAAQLAVPGGGRLRAGHSRAAARGRRDRDHRAGPGREARVRASLVHERGVRRPGAAPEGREGVRQHQSPRYGGLRQREDLLWGCDGGVRGYDCVMRVCEYWGPGRPGPHGSGKNVGDCLEIDFESDENKEWKASVLLMIQMLRCDAS